MTLANDVPSDLPRFFSLFRSADAKADPVAGPVKRPAAAGDCDKGDDDEATSDFVWALAYWPWL